MKNILPFFLIVLASVNLYAQSQSKRVLFLGNSYTYVNNLPKMIADMAFSAGDSLIYDSHTPGGYTLGNHLHDSISINKINLGNWDNVVLQDQSMALAYTSTFMNMLPYSYKLDSIIKVFNSCAQTMFYITWGRKNGDIYLCTPPECDTNTWITRTYYEMDSSIQSHYLFIADSLRALTSPVGATWRYIRQHYPSIELFQSDESHPSEAGTYAAACSFYTALFRKDPTLISFNSGLPATDASDIRNTVKLIVYDHLLNWNIGRYDSLLSTACFLSGINENNVNIEWSIEPNPVNDYLTIRFFENNRIKDVQIYNSLGTLVQDIEATSTIEIDVSHLPAGLYVIRQKNYPRKALKFIKQ